LYTTHVGSLPLEYSKVNVAKAFLDMVSIGIDYPPYPQLRGFIDIFLQPLLKQHVIVKRGEFYFLLQEEPVDIDVKEYIPEESVIVAKLVSSMSIGNIKGLRAPITGPFTLASKIFIRRPSFMSSLLSRKRQTLELMVDLVRNFALAFKKLGYDFLVLDEPILGTIVGARRLLFNYKPEDIRSGLDRIFERIHVLRGIHVCGRISKGLVEILLNLESIEVLDHEFADSPENLENYDVEILESHNKFIAFGCLSSKKATVEGKEEVLSLLKSGLNKYGRRLLMIKPDCGLGGLRGATSNPILDYRIAIDKLRMIVEVAKEVEY